MASMFSDPDSDRGSGGIGGFCMVACTFPARWAWQRGSASNTRVNPPVRVVTALAKSASPAPVQPAGYAQRSADKRQYEGEWGGGWER